MSAPLFPHDRLTLIFERQYRVTPEPNLVTSGFDDGYTGQRPRAARVPVGRTLRYRTCAKADYIFFRDWMRVTLKNGARFFRWRDPLTGQFRRARIPGGQYVATATNSRLDSWSIEFALQTLE